MPTSRSTSTDDRAEVERLRAAAGRVYDIPSVPRPLWAAIAHILQAAAIELDNGRQLPTACRDAAREVAAAIDQTLEVAE